jgi:hypothetical protein
MPTEWQFFCWFAVQVWLKAKKTCQSAQCRFDQLFITIDCVCTDWLMASGHWSDMVFMTSDWYYRSKINNLLPMDWWHRWKMKRIVSIDIIGIDLSIYCWLYQAMMRTYQVRITSGIWHHFLWVVITGVVLLLMTWQDSITGHTLPGW